MVTKKYSHTDFIHPPDGPIDEMEFEALRSAMDNSTRDLKKTIADLIDTEPCITRRGISERLRIGLGHTYRVVQKLAEEGHFGAQGVMQHNSEHKNFTSEGIAEVKQWFLDHPGETTTACCRELLYERKWVRNWVDRILKAEPGCIDVRNTLHPSYNPASKKREMARLLCKDPLLRPKALARQLCIEIKTAKKYYSELCDEYESQYGEMMHLARQYCTNEILITVNELKERAEKYPTQSARANEVKLQALKLFANLFGLTRPDVLVSINNVTIDQSQRDAAAEAALRQMNLVPQLNLPSFGLKEEIIDVEPE